jgi:hypothetical protein
MTARNRVRKGDALPGVPRSAWSIKEFAATLGIGYYTAYRMVTRQEVKSFRVLGEIRVPDSELQRLLSCDGAA